MGQSIQHKISRVRPPRVQITYDVEIGNAIEMKELAFVMGIMADLSAKSNVPLPKVKDRKFVDVDGDNFEDLMTSIKPRVAFSVENKLVQSEEPTKINLELIFEKMDDFNPVRVAQQVPVLNALYESRTKLSDLMAKLDGNDALDGMLKLIIENPEIRAALKAELDQA